MMHDALLILWECPPSDVKTFSQEYSDCFDHLDVSEQKIFSKIIKTAQTHSSIRKFILDYSFETTLHYPGGKNKRDFGLYLQALSDGMDNVLDPYRCHLVELQRKILDDPTLPLSFILGSLEAFKPLLQTLQAIVEKVNERHLCGCQIPDLLNHHSKSGNKDVVAAINKLLLLQHKIFYEQLCRWLLYGNIDVDYEEFIVHPVKKIGNSSASLKIESSLQSDNTKSTRNESTANISYPNNDYEINAIMLPSYIPYSLAEKILFVGKSVVLLESNPTEKSTNSICLLSKKQNSRFNIWGKKEHMLHEEIKKLKTQETFDIIKLEAFIDSVKSCVTEHLWVIAEKESGVLHELQVIKDYFLLGRGELFFEFLRLGEQILNSPPSLISTRDINFVFQNAIRAVLLDKNKDVEKFSFIIPFKKNDSHNNQDLVDNSDGWATIIMKYDVKWPLHLLFTTEVLNTYNQIFRFLLKLKKAQQDLHGLWFSHKKIRKDRGSTWQLLNKLIFLIDNIQHYIQADVLESNFSKLKTTSEKIKDIEELKKLHQVFLNDILSQAFLHVDQYDEQLGAAESFENKNPVMANLLELLQLCTLFCTNIDKIEDPTEEAYMLSGFTKRFEKLVGTLLQLLVALRTQPCGMHLTRLLMRLDYNRWFSSTAHLTQSVTNML